MTVTPSAETILRYAIARAQEAWADAQPYMLARLSPDLLKEGINYKEVLGEQRLKDFVLAAPDRIKVVTHPTQRSKIGLVPPDADFAFAPASESIAPQIVTSPTSGDRTKGSRRRYVVSNFLHLLSELDDADAVQVQIPMHILTKLMRD